MSRVNYYQSEFNSQKEKLNILAKMLEISKSGCGSMYNRPPSLKELLSELKKDFYSAPYCKDLNFIGFNCGGGAFQGFLNFLRKIVYQ